MQALVIYMSKQQSQKGDAKDKLQKKKKKKPTSDNSERHKIFNT